MSYATVHLFKDDVIWDSQEFKNSWKGSAYIWGKLFDRYIKKHEFDSWMNETKAKELWNLAGDKTIPLFERIVLGFTLDHALVYQKDFHEFESALRDFNNRYDKGSTSNSHLIAWADYIAENRHAQAVALYGTSVSEDLWEVFDEKNYVSYNLKTMNKHYDLFGGIKNG